MDLDSQKTQRIKGYFNFAPKEDFSGNLFLDRTRIRESYLVFDGIFPFTNRHDGIKFTTDKGIELDLKFPASYMGGGHSEIKYSIDSIKIPVAQQSNVYKTSFVKNLVYVPRKIVLEGIEFYHEEKSVYVGKRKIRKSFYEFTSAEIVNDNKLERLAAGLSIFLNTFFQIAEKQESGYLLIRDYISRDNRLNYYGSGFKYFPLLEHENERVISDRFFKKWRSVYYKYISFTTAEEMYGARLVQGISVLEVIVSGFEKLKKYQLPKNISKSEKLIHLLVQLNLSEKEKKYLVSIFLGLDLSQPKKNIHFEFFELRDKVVHRGFINLGIDSFPVFQRTTVSLNEVLRILFKRIHEIKDWNYTDRNTYQTLNSEEIVNTSQEIFFDERTEVRFKYKGN